MLSFFAVSQGPGEYVLPELVTADDGEYVPSLFLFYTCHVGMVSSKK